MNSFIKSEFSYSTLVWMLHDKVLNSYLNHILEMVLQLVCKGNETECEKLMNKTLTIH